MENTESKDSSGSPLLSEKFEDSDGKQTYAKHDRDIIDFVSIDDDLADAAEDRDEKVKDEEFLDDDDGDYDDVSIGKKPRHYGFTWDESKGVETIEASDTEKDVSSDDNLLPGIKGPKLWMVHCRKGDEKASVLKLMRRCLACKTSGKPLEVLSVVAQDGIKGLIFVEAFKQEHAEEAIYGINSLRMKQCPNQVPLEEMVPLLNVKPKPEFQPKQWVRVRRGMYKNDLAE